MLSQKQLNKAIRLNKKYQKGLGWKKQLIENKILKLEGSSCLTEREFAKSISRWQEENGFPFWECDGIVGIKTYKKLLKKSVKFKNAQFELLIKDYNNEKEFVSVSEVFFNFVKEYSEVTGGISNASELIEYSTGKNLTSFALKGVSKGYRKATKSINSMKVSVPTLKIIKFLKRAGTSAEALTIAMEWDRVEKGKEEISADLVLKTYIFFLSIIGEVKPSTPFSLSAKGVSTIYSLTEGHLEVGKKLNIVSDTIANFFIQWSLRQYEPKTKTILAYPTFDEIAEDRNTKMYLREKGLRIR